MTSTAGRAGHTDAERARYESTADAWADHLRSGGTTPWLPFCSRRGPEPGADDRPAGPSRPWPAEPRAVQLELVRRLALRARQSRAGPAPAAFTALADQVLSRPTPGRGSADRPLAWPEDPSAPADHRGAPPVDPSTLPAGELLRLSTGVVADLLVALGPPVGPPVAPGSALGRLAGSALAGSGLRAWRRRRRPSYRVLGSTAAAATVRAALAGAGPPLGGGLRDARVLVVVDSVDALLADAWASRVRHGSRTRWRTFVGACAARGTLPSSAGVDDLAAAWAARVGPDRVHVVAGRTPEELAAALGLGATPTAPRDADGPLPPYAVDVVRRANAVLRLRVPRESRPWYAGRLTEVLGDVPAWAPSSPRGGLRVPDRHRHWAATAGHRLARRLADAGYPVHGDLGVLSRQGGGPPGPPSRQTLEAMLDAVLVLGGAVPPGRPLAQGGRR